MSMSKIDIISRQIDIFELAKHGRGKRERVGVVRRRQLPAGRQMSRLHRGHTLRQKK